MSWNREEIQRDFTMSGDKNDPEHIDVLGDELDTTRDKVVIDYDKLQGKKKRSKHEEFELRMIERILNRERQKV